MRISWLVKLIVAFGVFFSIVIVSWYNTNIMVKVAISIYYFSCFFIIFSRKASYATLLFIISSTFYYVTIFSSYSSGHWLNNLVTSKIYGFCELHNRFVFDPEAADWDTETAILAHKRSIEDCVLYYRLLGLLLFSLISTSAGEVIDIRRNYAPFRYKRAA